MPRRIRHRAYVYWPPNPRTDTPADTVRNRVKPVFCMACGAKCNQNYQGMDEHYLNGVGFYICDCTYGSSCYAFPNLTPHLEPHPTPLSTPPGSGVSHRTPPGSENFATRRLCDSCFFKFNVLLLLLQQVQCQVTTRCSRPAPSPQPC